MRCQREKINKPEDCNGNFPKWNRERKKTSEQNINKLWDNFKQSKICVSSLLHRRGKKNNWRNLGQNFSKFHNYKHTDPKGQWTPNTRNRKKINYTNGLKLLIKRGAWVAQSVKCPMLAQVMILLSVSSSPVLGSVLTVQSLAPASDCVSLSLCLSLSLSLSQK